MKCIIPILEARLKVKVYEFYLNSDEPKTYKQAAQALNIHSEEIEFTLDGIRRESPNDYPTIKHKIKENNITLTEKEKEKNFLATEVMKRLLK